MNVQKTSRGFTLIELLVTLAVFIITLSAAAPSFMGVIQNNRTVNTTNDLIRILQMARSEAIKRGVSVSVCAAADQSYTSCGADWNLGWIIFVNPDENNTFNNDAVETLVRVQQVETNLAISLNPAGNVITYTSSGFANNATINSVFSVNASGCTTNHARQITISPTGRPIVANMGC